MFSICWKRSKSSVHCLPNWSHWTPGRSNTSLKAKLLDKFKVFGLDPTSKIEQKTIFTQNHWTTETKSQTTNPAPTTAGHLVGFWCLVFFGFAKSCATCGMYACVCGCGCVCVCVVIHYVVVQYKICGFAFYLCIQLSMCQDLFGLLCVVTNEYNRGHWKRTKQARPRVKRCEKHVQRT